MSAMSRALLRQARPERWTTALLSAFPSPMYEQTPTTPSRPTAATSVHAPSISGETGNPLKNHR